MSPEPGASVPAEAGRGVLIAVVGPSGAGKDTLIGYARQRLRDDPSVLFVRRVVTRPALAGAEDHDTLSSSAFEAQLASGEFAVHWEAHGLRYAIPMQTHAHVEAGGVAVINGSRAALPTIRSAFPRVLTVHVTCRPDVLAARLAARGREDAAQQQQRIARASIAMDPLVDAVEIDNSGDLATAGNALAAIIQTTSDGRAAGVH